MLSIFFVRNENMPLWLTFSISFRDNSSRSFRSFGFILVRSSSRCWLTYAISVCNCKIKKNIALNRLMMKEKFAFKIYLPSNNLWPNFCALQISVSIIHYLDLVEVVLNVAPTSDAPMPNHRLQLHDLLYDFVHCWHMWSPFSRKLLDSLCSLYSMHLNFPIMCCGITKSYLI